jgi:hypothetical protein
MKRAEVRCVVAALAVGVVVAGTVCVWWLDRRADLTIPYPASWNVDARNARVGIVGTEYDIPNASFGQRWIVFLADEDYNARQVWMQEGICFASWLSPDSSQMLLGWSAHVAGERTVERRVVQLSIGTGEAAVLRELSGHLLSLNYYGVTPWNRDGTSWLSFKREGGCTVHHAQGGEVALPPITHGFLAWLPDEHEPKWAYALDFDGNVYRLSESQASVVTEIPKVEKAKVTALGDYLFYLSEDEGTLTRVDLRANARERRAVGLPGARTGRVYRLHAVADDLLTIISVPEKNEQTTTVAVFALHWPAMKLERLWSRRFSNDEVEELVDSAAYLVTCTGDRERIWIAWDDGKMNKTMLASHSLTQ